MAGRSTAAGHALNDLAAALAVRRRRRVAWVGWSLVGWSRNRVALVARKAAGWCWLIAHPVSCNDPTGRCGIARPVLRRFAGGVAVTTGRAQTFIALEVHGSEHASTHRNTYKAMLFQHGQPDVAALEMVCQS